MWHCCGMVAQQVCLPMHMQLYLSPSFLFFFLHSTTRIYKPTTMMLSTEDLR